MCCTGLGAPLQLMRRVSSSHEAAVGVHVQGCGHTLPRAPVVSLDMARRISRCICSLVSHSCTCSSRLVCI